MADTNINVIERAAAMDAMKRYPNASGSDLSEHHDAKGTPSVLLDDHLKAKAAKAQKPAGVKQMEAIIQVWTKKWLITAYVLITLISFVNSLQQQANFIWTPWVSSAFQKHGLTAMISLVANVVSGVSKLPLATFINVCGRPHGFAICLLFVVLSLVMMAVCHNVQTFAAAQVFYWVGMNGMNYVLDIFIADTSLMKNRLIWLAITGSPYICNAFAGPSLGQAFLHHSSWRWGYSVFAIITPFICIPFWVIFYVMNGRAHTMGVIKNPSSNRTFVQSVVHWCIEFDVVGLILICSGFCILLLPFSFATTLKHSWASPTITSMIIIGLLLLVAFGVWEYSWAPKTFFPFHLMKDRSVVAACLLGFNGWIAFYSYKMFYSSYLQVVFNISVSKAGYIVNIFSIVSCFWAVIISIAFRYTDTYRWAAFIATPVQIFMAGLLIKFRKPGTHIGLLVMVEVLYAMGGAVLVQIEQVAVMAAVPHENVATGLALLAMITSVGGAVGQSISGAVWTNIVLKKLTLYLPDNLKAEAPAIYADLKKQLSFPMGSPERTATIQAYGEAQKIMVIVATCSLLPCLLWTAMLKNIRLSQHRRQRGLQA